MILPEGKGSHGNEHEDFKQNKGLTVMVVRVMTIKPNLSQFKK